MTQPELLSETNDQLTLSAIEILRQKLDLMGLGMPGTARVFLERQDIVFFSPAPGRLCLELTLRNRDREASRPTIARVSAAPLGAFVPWEPLLNLNVPAIPAGGRLTLRAITAPPFRARRPSPVRVPAFALHALRATGLVDRQEREVHWAGNVDVFVHGRAVERHMAMSLHLSPGGVNVADFVVGDRDDDYSFDVTGDVTGWNVGLQALHPAWGSLRKKKIPLGSWVRFHSQQMLWLVAKPPRQSTGGRVSVHIRQRSTERDAVVEFGFAA
jgi:hypothetical protein